jgi:hypothetical protein
MHQYPLGVRILLILNLDLLLVVVLEYSNFLRPGRSEHESESRVHQRVRGLVASESAPRLDCKKRNTEKQQ